MAEFRLGRLKFNWRGAWAASTAYVIDDIVRYGANSYVCTSNHTSDSASNGFPTDAAYWSLHTKGMEDAGNWTPSTAYVLDDIVKEGGNLYICTAQHTSIGIESSWYASDFPAYWDLYHEGLSFKGAFTTDTYYGINAVVSYGPYNYRCTVPFQVPADQSMQGISTSVHDPSGIGSDLFYPPGTNFVTFAQGFDNRGKYLTNTRYERGDIVEYNGTNYVAISTNPINLAPAQNANDWSVFTLGIGTGGATLFDPGQFYTKGQLVTLGGNTYIADEREIAVSSDNSPVGNAVTSVDTGVNGWSLINRGTSWKGTWDNATYYQIGDLAEYSSSTYISVASSNLNVQPGTAVTMWQAFAIGDSAALLTSKGDILTRNATGPTRQGIGTQGTYLRVSSTDEVEWQYAGQLTKVYYVDAQQGSDSNNGLTPDNSWGSVAYASTAAQRVRDITNFVYDESTGITTITAAGHGLFAAGQVKLSGIAFTCATEHAGVTTTIFPDGTQGFFFRVDSVIDSDTFVTNVGISTIAHSYVSGGHVTDVSPVILKLSAGTFREQLPITLPKNFNIAGDVLRGTIIEPATGLSTDGVTPNARQTMFFVSDSCTVQALTLRGLQGFSYDTLDPFNTDLWQSKVGLGTTATGAYFRLNPETPILDRSPYIKDCTAFSDVCTDGTGHGGAIGVWIEGGKHEGKPEGSGAKSMVFDAFTHIHSGGVGFWLEDDALAEIVSCFTYYCAFGYVSDDGSEIRSLSGNNSYGDYGAIAVGFSTLETARVGRLYGDKLELVVGTPVGDIAVGATMRGTESGARAVVTNEQISGEQIYFKYNAGFGNPDGANGAVGIGTSVFVPGEFVEVDSVGAGATGIFRIKSTSTAVSGQKDILFEIVGLTTTPKVGDALGFTTVGLGFSDTNTYIIRTVSNYDSGTGRATINVAPGKGSAPASFDNQAFLMRTKFSKVRLTGHDFLLIGTGNTSLTNYPDVDENNASQGNEVNTVNSGKIFYVSTDQGGNFRVGEFFSVNQLTGAATLDASAFNLSGLTELRLGAIGGQVGEAVNEFSSDETLGGDSNTACPTEKATRGFLTRGKMDNTSGILVPPRGVQINRPTGVDLLEGGLRYDLDLNRFEYYNGSRWYAVGQWQNVDVSANGTTLNPGEQAFCNTSGGAFTITLPASPVKGDAVRIFDTRKTFDTQNLTVARNGNPIMGDAANLTLSTEGAALELVFFDASQGWRIITI